MVGSQGEVLPWGPSPSNTCVPGLAAVAVTPPLCRVGSPRRLLPGFTSQLRRVRGYLDDPTARDAAGALGRRHAETHFDIAGIGDEFIRIIRHAMGHEEPECDWKGVRMVSPSHFGRGQGEGP